MTREAMLILMQQVVEGKFVVFDAGDQEGAVVMSLSSFKEMLEMIGVSYNEMKELCGQMSLDQLLKAAKAKDN
jgi:hypothetical protein